MMNYKYVVFCRKDGEFYGLLENDEQLKSFKIDYNIANYIICELKEIEDETEN